MLFCLLFGFLETAWNVTTTHHHYLCNKADSCGPTAGDANPPAGVPADEKDGVKMEMTVI